MRRSSCVLLIVTAILVASGCDWRMGGFGPGRTNVNPGESAINADNVDTLVPDGSFGINNRGGSAIVGGGHVVVAASQLLVYDEDTGDFQWRSRGEGSAGGSALIAQEIVFSGARAYDLAGATNCSGSPVICDPLWTAALPAGSTGISSPVVQNGLIYFTSYNGTGTLSVFAVDGGPDCGGTPKTCQPLWTATSTGSLTHVALSKEYVFVGTGAFIAALDAHGVEGCSGVPKTCTRLWNTQAVNAYAFPTVANGVLYGSFGDAIYAYDAAGVQNCGGTPKVCNPNWQYAAAGGIAVTGSTLYTTTYDPNVPEPTSEDARVGAFSADGSEGCAGAPVVCAPLWTTSTYAAGPVVANGVVFTSGHDDDFSAPIAAFDANGTVQCTGTPKVCDALASYPAEGGGLFVANGRLYETTNVDGQDLHVRRWSLPES